VNHTAANLPAGGGMLMQLRGKVRRAVVGAMLSEEDRAVIARARHGECNRCGACCKILFQCPFLVEVEGGFTCSVYDHRPPSCRLFPMAPADLREVERCAISFEQPR
jgi:Fe-S-cluster containining protein